MSERSAKILLASVILARSSSYVLQKIGLTDIDVFNLMGIRFLTAFFIMLLIFNKKLLGADKASVAAGLIVGAVYFVVMSFEVFSLKSCESSTTAFLENTAIVMVPLFEAFLLKNMPLPKTVAGFLLAMSGVALMTLQGTSVYFSVGHVLALGAAVTYAAAIIITDRVSKKADALVIGIVQLGTMGSLSALASFIFETPHLPGRSPQYFRIDRCCNDSYEYCYNLTERKMMLDFGALKSESANKRVYSEVQRHGELGKCQQILGLLSWAARQVGEMPTNRLFSYGSDSNFVISADISWKEVLCWRVQLGI